MIAASNDFEGEESPGFRGQDARQRLVEATPRKVQQKDTAALKCGKGGKAA